MIKKQLQIVTAVVVLKPFRQLSNFRKSFRHRIVILKFEDIQVVLTIHWTAIFQYK